MIIRRVLSCIPAAVLLVVLAASASAQISNLSVRAATANISSGSSQSYEQAGRDILKALKPDIVAIQEFKAAALPAGTNDANMRALVDEVFGTNFYYFKQTDASYGIPNGIVSRWPILTNGTWDDPIPTITDRGFAWAQIDLPGTNDLYVVSVHLYSSGSASQRDEEATAVKSNIVAYFPPNAWILVGGDFNTGSRGEAAVTTFKTFLSDYPIPTDQSGDPDTNAGRSGGGGSPYDYILPSFNLTNYLAPVVMPSHTFNNGLVFDTRVYTPTNDFLPAVATNSAAFQMQHMAVVKNFLLPVFGTNAGPVAPSIATQPQSQTNNVGTPVEFTVTASGTAPLFYQWRLNTTNLAGANATNYSIASVQTTNAGDYTVIITNLAGSATSTVATLTVQLTDTPPNITVNPASITNLSGTTANFSVTATGTAPLSYQWRFNGTNISATATNSSYAKANVQTNDAGPYTVIITNIAGAVTSTPALLTVTSAGTNSFTGVIAGWDVSGQTSFGTSPMPPTTNAANLTIVGLTRGAGVPTTNTAAGRAWGGVGFDAANASAAVASNDFAYLSLSADAGFQVSYSAISRFDYRRSGSGPANGVLQYQIGAGSFTDITTLAYPVNTSTGGSLAAIDLSGIGALQNVGPGTNVTFRIVNYGGGPSATWYVFDFANTTAPDLAITGTIAPLAPPSGPPAAAPTLSTPTLAGSQFIFQLTGTATSNYVVQVSTNLSNWIPLQTNPAPFWFTNPIGQPQQFFRGTVAP